MPRIPFEDPVFRFLARPTFAAFNEVIVDEAERRRMPIIPLERVCTDAGGRHVLVVEDEMLILMMIEDMLSDLGCESVVTASTVDQALAKINAQAFDVAMLDSNLDGTSSDPVAEALAARGVPFFFATGQKSAGTGRENQDHPVLKKPFNFEGLEASLRQMLSVKE